MRSVGHPSAWKQWVWNTRCYQTKTILTMIDFTDSQPSPSFWKLGWQYLNRVAHTAVTVSITVSPLTLQIRIRTDPVWLPQIHADFHRFYMIYKNRNPPLVFFAAVRTHKNQDKPLALDASLLRDLDGAAVWKSLSELRYFQPPTSSPYGFRINRKAINRK